jgi:hypothetical protein
MAEDGAEEVTPALGRGIDALVAGVEEAGVEVEEAAKGVIIDTMPGAYFFAFLKKPSSSKKRSTTRRANLLPINLLVVRISKCNGPSAPRFTERLFINRIGSSTVSKAAASFLRSAVGTSILFFGHNPTNIRFSMQRVSSRISWTDIQFNSSKFTAAIRGSSSSGCKGAKDTPVFSMETQKTETRDNEQTPASRRMSK